MSKCGKRYGSRRTLRCARLAGHKGKHGKNPTAREMGVMLMKERRSAN